MILGLSPLVFLHTALSIVALGFGAVVMRELVAGRVPPRANTWLLATAVATVVTGFLLPFEKFLPSHAVGVLSSLTLAAAIYARQARALAGAWRAVYAAAATISIYFNYFVGGAQAFTKIPALHQAAPTLAEPPFVIAQSLLLLAFAVLGFLAVRAAGRPAAAAALG